MIVPDVSFVILSWNSAHYIKQCILSYANSLSRESIVAEFIIIDNGSKDKTVKIVEEEIAPLVLPVHSCRVIRMSKNKGTTASRNKGLAVAAGKYIVVCDSDTEYYAGNWMNLIGILNQNNRIGLLVPEISYPNKSIQHSVKRFPILQDKLGKLRTIFLKKKNINTDFYPDFPWKDCRTADTAISAFWFFKRNTIEIVGLLDEKIFYSPEDIDYCLRIWKSGKQIYFCPFFKIVHFTQQLSHKKPISFLAISHFYGLLYLFFKHKYCFSRTKLYEQIESFVGRN
jgi:GT2 family glycosyltransferase